MHLHPTLYTLISIVWNLLQISIFSHDITNKNNGFLDNVFNKFVKISGKNLRAPTQHFFKNHLSTFFFIATPQHSLPSAKTIF